MNGIELPLIWLSLITNQNTRNNMESLFVYGANQKERSTILKLRKNATERVDWNLYERGRWTVAKTHVQIWLDDSHRTIQNYWHPTYKTTLIGQQRIFVRMNSIWSDNTYPTRHSLIGQGVSDQMWNGALCDQSICDRIGFMRANWKTHRTSAVRADTVLTQVLSDQIQFGRTSSLRAHTVHIQKINFSKIFSKN